MPRSQTHARAPVVLLMAVCVLLPALLALVAVGMGTLAGTTQGLTQATGALSAAAFQGLGHRGIDLAPAFLPAATTTRAWRARLATRFFFGLSSR